MEGDFIFGYGADGQWHLWVGKTGGGVVRKATTIEGDAGECLVPPESWTEVEIKESSTGGMPWRYQPQWDQKVAYVMAYALCISVFEGQFPVRAVADQAHALWWLGEGGRARVVRQVDARQWFLEAARRGKWGQLELPMDREAEAAGIMRPISEVFPNRERSG